MEMTTKEDRDLSRTEEAKVSKEERHLYLFQLFIAVFTKPPPNLVAKSNLTVLFPPRWFFSTPCHFSWAHPKLPQFAPE